MSTRIQKCNKLVTLFKFFCQNVQCNYYILIKKSTFMSYIVILTYHYVNSFWQFFGVLSDISIILSHKREIFLNFYVNLMVTLQFFGYISSADISFWLLSAYFSAFSFLSFMRIPRSSNMPKFTFIG